MLATQACDVEYIKLQLEYVKLASVTVSATDEALLPIPPVEHVQDSQALNSTRHLHCGTYAWQVSF